MIQSCMRKSQIINSRICPNCLADNPTLGQDFCGTCYILDKKVLTEGEQYTIVGSY